MPTEANFESILASQNQAFQEAESFSRWMPPDGPYNLIIVKCGKRAKNEDDGTITIYWVPTFKIIAPHNEVLDNKEFSPLFSSKAFGSFKALVAGLAGGSIPPGATLVDADRIYVESVGAVVKAEISRSTAKKGGEFVNITITELVQTQETVSDGGGAEVEAPPEAEKT